MLIIYKQNNDGKKVIYLNYMKQFAIIIAVSFLGEIGHEIIPLPVPASIYGLILMLVLLMTGFIPHTAVKETGHFLIDIMPLMFIPAAVGLMVSFDILKPVLLPYIVITVLTTFIVMIIAGRVTQRIIISQERRYYK